MRQVTWASFAYQTLLLGRPVSFLVASRSLFSPPPFILHNWSTGKVRRININIRSHHRQKSWTKKPENIPKRAVHVSGINCGSEPRATNSFSTCLQMLMNPWANLKPELAASSSQDQQHITSLPR